MYLKDGLRGSFNFFDFFRVWKFNRDFRKSHPDYFVPDGTIVFCGPQGSGKTLSAVRYVKRLLDLYPKCILISNTVIRGYEDRTITFEGLDEETIKQYPDNGEFGTIFFIDEIQIWFSSLESRNVPPSIIAIICQQRKRRVHIVGTSQLFTRIAKPFREQIRCAVDCSNLSIGRFITFKCVQDNRIIDFDNCAYDINGELTETAYKGRFIWTRSPSLFNLYDTTAIIERKEAKSNVGLVHSRSNRFTR